MPMTASLPKTDGFFGDTARFENNPALPHPSLQKTDGFFGDEKTSNSRSGRRAHRASSASFVPVPLEPHKIYPEMQQIQTKSGIQIPLPPPSMAEK